MTVAVIIYTVRLNQLLIEVPKHRIKNPIGGDNIGPRGEILCIYPVIFARVCTRVIKILMEY